MKRKTNAAYLELHTHTSRYENSQRFVSNDPGDCCCAPHLDATSFENGSPTTEELACSVVSEGRVCNISATCISNSISLVPVVPCLGSDQWAVSVRNYTAGAWSWPLIFMYFQCSEFVELYALHACMELCLDTGTSFTCHTKFVYKLFSCFGATVSGQAGRPPHTLVKSTWFWTVVSEGRRKWLAFLLWGTGFEPRNHWF
jgi:hypothetical protein